MTATFTKAHLPDVVHMEDNIWAMLPEDLLNEILARVPPFMIFRLRSICRRWNSILQDNGFLRFHSQVPSHGPCLLTFWKNLNVPQCTVFSLPLKQWYKIPFVFLPPWAFWLVGASGGLVCFSGLDGLTFRTLICNPLTQRWRMLPSMHYNQQRLLIMVVHRKKRCLHASSSPQRCSYGGGDIEAGKRSAEIELDEFFKKVQHIEKEFDKLNKLIRKLQVDCDEHKSVCTKFGVSGYPTIQWFPKGSLEPKKYEGARTAEALVEFVNLEGGTNAKIASVPSIVVILNSDNFDEIVLNGNKDVLVEFYAPWCGHCKILAPTYETLAAAFKNEEDVVIANLDADNHKDLAEKYGVSGYPTIKFFPKTNKDGEDYEGGRDIDSFVTLRVGQFGVW